MGWFRSWRDRAPVDLERITAAESRAEKYREQRRALEDRVSQEISRDLARIRGDGQDD